MAYSFVLLRCQRWWVVLEDSRLVGFTILAHRVHAVPTQYADNAKATPYTNCMLQNQFVLCAWLAKAQSETFVLKVDGQNGHKTKTTQPLKTTQYIMYLHLPNISLQVGRGGWVLSPVM